MNNDPVIIAGGGIAGLGAALAAANAGQQVLLLERASQFEEVGAGLQLGPNAVHALQRLGVWEDVAAITSAPPAIILHDARRSAVLKRIGLSGAFEAAFGAPYRVAHRADLHGALLAAVRARPNIVVRTGKAVQSVQMNGEATGARVLLASGETVDAGLVIAADGVNSALRQDHFAVKAPVSAGHVIHRALLSDCPASMPEPDAVHLWMGPGFHVVHYPVGQKGKLNLVCVTAEGLTPEHILPHCAAPLADVLRHTSHWLPWPALYVPALVTWQKACLLLVGDAAHGTVPYLAQGAAMALEDAAHLQALLQGKSQGELAGLDFSTRIDRTQKLHRQSLANGRIYHMAGLGAQARNAVLRALPERLLLRRLGKTYGSPLRK